MPLDPSIFMQGAKLQIDSRNQLLNSLNDSAKLYQEAKNKGLDFDKLTQQSALNVMSGNGSPQDYQILQAKDLLDGPKTSYVPNPDGSGTLVPTTQPSIMDRLSQMGARQYTPSFPPLGGSPMKQTQPNMGVAPTGAMGAIPALSMEQLDQPMPRIGVQPPVGLMRQQQDALNMRDDVFTRSTPALPQVQAPIGASPKTQQVAQEANVEIQKAVAGIPAAGAKAEAEKAGQLLAESTQKKLDAASRAGNIFIGIDEAEKYLKKASGGLLPYGKNIVKSARGISDEQTQANNQLKLISGWMVSNVPRMEGPQSNFDVENYKAMAADVGNELKPIGDRMAALKTLRDLQKKYSDQPVNKTNEGNIPRLAPDGNYYIEDKNRPGKYLRVDK